VASDFDPPLTPAASRRLVVLGVLRGLAVTSVLIAAYYVAPLERLAELRLGIVMLVGLGVLTAVTIYQVRAVLRAAHPAVRAVEALTLTGPLFLLLFSATYFVLSEADAGNFNVPGLTRSDALYFTVTIFATVGFGDIVATSQTARVLVTVQMILDLILIGAVVRIFIGAVRLARRSAP
jgi:voltage-gated potassium channel